ncbi:PREDICTED: uncharacterized protein LOC106813278 [Priapulus caudatus]|uniref:Uncharacterized protein LOC106813278 n=1 Tax=Priapulus caudatus TaxID=37621 RepID=A0ABM1EKZ9_PRICU|nr:PREDICTED: uncharacterized protein LOC106813278 [Priapulus caudatus]
MRQSRAINKRIQVQKPAILTSLGTAQRVRFSVRDRKPITTPMAMAMSCEGTTGQPPYLAARKSPLPQSTVKILESEEEAGIKNISQTSDIDIVPETEANYVKSMKELMEEAQFLAAALDQSVVLPLDSTPISCTSTHGTVLTSDEARVADSIHTCVKPHEQALEICFEKKEISHEPSTQDKFYFSSEEELCILEAEENSEEREKLEVIGCRKHYCGRKKVNTEKLTESAAHDIVDTEHISLARKQIHYFCTLPDTVSQLPSSLQTLLKEIGLYGWQRGKQVGNNLDLLTKVENQKLNSSSTTNVEGEPIAVPMHLWWAPAPPKLCLLPSYVEACLFPNLIPADPNLYEESVISQGESNCEGEDELRLREQLVFRKQPSLDTLFHRPVNSPTSTSAESAPELCPTEADPGFINWSEDQLYEACENELVVKETSHPDSSYVTTRRQEDIDRFLAHIPSVLQRSQSQDLQERYVLPTLQRAKSIPDSLDFDEYAFVVGNRMMAENDREWVRDIWNQWFDEVFPLPESESSAIEIEGCPKLLVQTNADDSRQTVLLSNADKEGQLTVKVQEELNELSSKIDSSEGLVAIHLCRRGAIYLKLNQLEMAYQDITKSLKLEPQLMDGYWHRHNLLLKQKKPKAAIEDLNKIISGTSQPIKAYKSRGDVYEKIGDISMAILSYDQAIALSPTDYESHLRRAELYILNGQLSLAHDDLKTAVKLSPARTEARMKQVELYLSDRQWQLAVSGLTVILERDPYNTNALLLRGQALIQQESWQMALRDVSAVVHLDPCSSKAFYHRGCLLRKVDSRRALQDLSVSLLLDPGPDNVMAYFHRAIIYHSISKYEASIHDFIQAVNLDHSLVAALVNIGIIYMLKKKDCYKALKYFMMAVREDPTNIRARLCRAKAYRLMKMHRKALSEITQIIHLRPDVLQYYMYRGDLLFELGDLELARFCIEQAAELNLGLRNSPSQEAVVQSFLGNHAKASEVLKMALQRQPQAHHWLLLGNAQMKAGDFVEAVESLEQALLVHGSKWSTHQESVQRKAAQQLTTADLTDAHYSLGISHIELGNHNLALDYLNNALTGNQRFALAHFHKGELELEQGKKKGMFSTSKALAVNPSLFQAFLSRAAFYSLEGKYSKAILNCNEAIKLRPDCTRAYLYRGALKYKIQAYKLAVSDLTKTIELDKKCAVAYFNRAICLQQLKMYQMAVQDFSLVLLLDKAGKLKLRAVTNRALLYLHIGDTEAALYDMVLAHDMCPYDPVIIHTLGVCYHRLQQLQTAVLCFSDAAKLDKFMLEAYVGRANALMDYGSDSAQFWARKDYERVLRLQPTYLPARIALAFNLQAAGKFQKAWNHLSIAVSLDPGYAPALEARAVVCLQMSNKFAALQDMNTAVHLSPSPAHLSNRGVIQQSIGDMRNAVEDFQAAVRKDPTHALAHYNLGNVYLSNRQYKQAAAEYTMALEKKPADDAMFMNRALAKVMLKDTSGALDDLEKAAKLASQNGSIYFNRGNLYYTLQQYELAELDYSTALALQPGDPILLQCRSLARGKLHRFTDAMVDHQSALCSVE